MTWETTKDKSLSDQAYERLADKLVSLQISPGQHLSISALARDFGMSETPVRSALTLLEAEGMVERKHHTGFRVSSAISSGELAQIFSVRLLLEPEAAKLAARNARQSDIDALEQLNNEMKESLRNQKNGVHGRFAILDKRFHHELALIGDNMILARIITSIHSHFHLFRVGHHESAFENAAMGHKEVINAIIERDTVAAAEAMRRHICKSMENALKGAAIADGYR